MSSDLVVAVFGGCALFQVHRFEHCVFTEFFSDGKHRLLQLSLTLQVSSVGFLFLFFCCIICEKIELGKAVFLLQSSVLRDNVVGDNIQPADQERRIDKTIEKIDGGVHDPVGRGGIVVQILGSMRLLWNRAAVAVCFDGTVVGGSPGGIGQVFDIVADGEDNLVGYDFFIYKIEGELVCHFFQNELCFVCLIRTMQNLPGADAVGFRFVGFDFRDGAGFKAPGVVDQKLCIFSEKPIEQVFIFDRAACDIPHREQSIFGKLSGIAVSDAPEVSG